MNVYFLLVLLILSHCSEDACFHFKLPPMWKNDVRSTAAEQDCTPACSSETRLDAHYKCSVCQRGSAGGTLANLISAGTWKPSHLLMQVTA